MACAGERVLCKDWGDPGSAVENLQKWSSSRAADTFLHLTKLFPINSSQAFSCHISDEYFSNQAEE